MDINDMLGRDITLGNISKKIGEKYAKGIYRFEDRDITCHVYTDDYKCKKYKIMALVVNNDNTNVDFIVDNVDSNIDYVCITHAFRGKLGYDNVKFRCLNEKSCGAVLHGVEDGDRKYLIVYNKKEKSGFPKGHIEYGETELQAASREIFEETGLKVDLDTNFRTSISYVLQDVPTNKEVVFYIGKINDINKIKIDEDEIVKYDFVTFEEAKNVLNDKLGSVLTKAKNYLE